MSLWLGVDLSMLIFYLFAAGSIITVSKALGSFIKIVIFSLSHVKVAWSACVLSCSSFGFTMKNTGMSLPLH